MDQVIGRSRYLCALVALVAGAAQAGLFVGGDAVVTDPPADITLHQWESNTEIRVWFERQATLAADLDSIGHGGTGFVNDDSMVQNFSVAAGTNVRSYMIRHDAIGMDPGTSLLSGFVVFENPIIGVIIGQRLNETDAIFGRAGVDYNDGHDFRGLELDDMDTEEDSFEISADRLRVDFTMRVGTWTDDIRVLTAVPAPAGAALFVGCFCAVRRRRR